MDLHVILFTAEALHEASLFLNLLYVMHSRRIVGIRIVIFKLKMVDLVEHGF